MEIVLTALHGSIMKFMRISSPVNREGTSIMNHNGIICYSHCITKSVTSQLYQQDA